MRKDKPEIFNCYVPQRYLDLVNEQQEVYPLLKPSDIIGNILDIYYRGSASWIKHKNSFNSIEAQEEE